MHERSNPESVSMQDAERYITVIRSLPDIVYRIDPEGRFLFINDAARNLGYEPGELIGEHFSKIVHPDDVRAFARNFVLPAYRGTATGDARAPKLFDERRTGKRKTRDLEVRLLVKKKAKPPDERIGTVIAFGDVSSTGHYAAADVDSDRRFLGTLGIIRDVTERKRSEALLSKLNRALSMVTECDQVLVRATDVNQLLLDICRIIVDMGGYRFTWVGMVADAGQPAIQPVARAGHDQGYLDAVDFTLAGTEREPVSRAILTGKTEIIKNLSTCPARGAWRAEGVKRGYAALIALPLCEDGRVIGSLNIYAAEPDVFDAEEVKLLRELADDVAYGIVALHARAEAKRSAEDLQRSYKLLRKIFEQTVNALSSAVGKRDPYTTDHQRRVTTLACAMAQQMGLNEEQINGIRLAGMLHDIGKLAVPSEILSKPTRLSEAEFAIIKTHPTVASEILRAVEFPWPIADIVLQHHERLDGSGYPAGLTGDNILLETRILSVADVVEAISSHRPYRPAHSLEYTLGEISKDKGVIYDPEAVNTCLRLFREKGFRFEPADAANRSSRT